MTLDDIDAALLDAVQRYLRERYAFDAQQRRGPAERRCSATAWRDMALQGWFDVAIGEDAGGLGQRIGAMALMAQAAGAALVNEPLHTSGFIAPDVLMRHGTAAQQADLLARVRAGTLRPACLFADASAPIRVEGGLLTGRREVVLDGDIADGFLVQADDPGSTRWHWIDSSAPGVARTPYPLLDGRGAATVDFDAAAAEPLQPGTDDHPAHLAALLLAADAAGCMQAAMDLTLGHLKTRRQFGAAIGTHQVLQHRAVDMYIRLRECQAVLTQAVASLQAQPLSAARDVHAAKAFIGQQAVLLAQEAVQLHGGIGITEEYALSHLLRRAVVDSQLLGGYESHLGRFAATPFIA